MKTRNKALLVLLCAMMLVAGSVFGTMAYLTDSEGATNTFTVGKVGLTLDEAKVDEYGKELTGNAAERVKTNSYHLLPGHTYDKDPTVTVDADSEDSYVRMMMTVYNATAVQNIIDADDTKDEQGNVIKGNIVDYANLFDGWNDDVWLYEGYVADAGANTITFEFRYKTTVNDKSGPGKNGVLEPLFTELVVPGYVTNEQLAALYGTKPEGVDEKDFKGEFKIEIEAHAIQAAGFETKENLEADDVAWKAFDAQVKP